MPWGRIGGAGWGPDHQDTAKEFIYPQPLTTGTSPPCPARPATPHQRMGLIFAPLSSNYIQGQKDTDKNKSLQNFSI